MNPRAPSQRGAALRAHPRRASGIAARPKSGRLRRVGRIALYGVIGFIISSIVLGRSVGPITIEPEAAHRVRQP
jgi:hypothetical protein